MPKRWAARAVLDGNHRYAITLLNSNFTLYTPTSTTLRSVLLAAISSLPVAKHNPTVTF